MPAAHAPLFDKCQRYTPLFDKIQRHIHRYSTSVSRIYTPLFDKVDVHSFVHTTRACVRMFATRSKVESNTCIGGPARLLKELLDAMNVSFVLANRAPNKFASIRTTTLRHHNSPASTIYCCFFVLFCESLQQCPDPSFEGPRHAGLPLRRNTTAPIKQSKQNILKQRK